MGCVFSKNTDAELHNVTFDCESPNCQRSIYSEAKKLMQSEKVYFPNQAVAVLGNGSVYRMLYLKLPSKTSETAAVPFTVLADVIVPGEVINSGTSYYPMKNESYMFFATDNGLYRYNLRDLENGNAPGSQNRIMTLTDFGYNADDKITCMTVSRTEQEILLGISRYGEDTEGMGEELKETCWSWI